MVSRLDEGIASMRHSICGLGYVSLNVWLPFFRSVCCYVSLGGCVCSVEWVGSEGWGEERQREMYGRSLNVQDRGVSSEAKEETDSYRYSLCMFVFVIVTYSNVFAEEYTENS